MRTSVQSVNLILFVEINGSNDHKSCKKSQKAVLDRLEWAQMDGGKSLFRVYMLILEKIFEEHLQNL